jgi:chitinase
MILSVMLITLSSLACYQMKETERWSLGYWTPWGSPALPPDQIEWSGLTHVVYAWALVRPDARLDLSTQRVSSEAPALVAAAHSRGAKVLLGIAQPYWLKQTSNLPQAARQHRSRLVENVMSVVDAYGFDGVDIDWEPFDPQKDGETLRMLAADLRERLGNRLLSAAAIINDYSYWGTIHRDFDRIGVMTYDFAGTWNPYTWHNAALYHVQGAAASALWPRVWSVDLAVRRFSNGGVPLSKLSIGIPFFGREWEGEGLTGPGKEWVSRPSVNYVSYQKLSGAITPDRYRWDSVARVPYLTIEDTAGPNDRFLTYDNEQSVVEKVNYAKSKGLGGWIIWELSGDYFPAQTPSQPLLHAIKNANHGL